MSNPHVGDFAIGPVVTGGLAAGATEVQLQPGYINNFPEAPGLIVVFNNSGTSKDNPSADSAKEICLYTTKNVGANKLQGLTRGLGGTSDVNHTTGTPTVFSTASADYLRGIELTAAMWGAKEDGSTNDAPAIQAAVNLMAPIGGILKFSPGKSYRVNATIAIPITARNFYMNMRGSTIEGYVNGPIITISDLTTPSNRCENVVLEGGTINGRGANDGTYTAQNGIEIYASLGVFLRGTRVTNIPNIGIYGQKSAAGGSAYWNKIILDGVSVRFIGKGGLQVGTTGGACDDLEIRGCLLNNLGQRLTTEPTGSDAGVYLNVHTLTMTTTELSAIRNQNGTNGYIRAMILRHCSGLLAGVHFEDNCNNQAGSYDLLLDTDANGMVISGCNHSCDTTTSSRDGIRTTSKDTVLIGVVHSGGATHTLANLIDVSGSTRAIVVSYSDQGTPPSSKYVNWAAGTDTPIVLSGGTLDMTKNFIEGYERTAPAAPGANGYRLYAEDNGAGKTRLMCLFNTGVAQQVAIQP